MEHNPKLCDCPVAGYCEKYKRKMDQGMWNWCNTEGPKGDAYREIFARKATEYFPTPFSQMPKEQQDAILKARLAEATTKSPCNCGGNKKATLS